jgi:TRAP-type mannitol/chloroaromatic compound transport system substrate-binding protein
MGTIIAATVAALLIAGFGPGGLEKAHAKDVYKFTLQNMFSMNHPVTTSLNVMIEELKKMSEGQIQIQAVPPGALVKSDKIFESVGVGAIDMGTTCSCYHGGILPMAAAAFALPGDPRDVFDILHFIYEDGTIDFFREAYAKHNVVYGAPLVWDGYALVSKKPVRTWEDLQKLKVRATGTTARTLQRLDVPTVFIPFSEIYVALSRGTIDAEISGNHAESFLAKTYEVAKYQMTPDVSGAQNCEIIINKERWEEMPEHLRAIMNTAMRDFSFRVARVFSHETKLARAKMEASGAEYLEMPPEVVEKWKTEAMKIWDEMLAKQDPLSAEYIQRVKENLKALGYEVQ